MSENTYRWFSAVAGAVAGAVCVVGFVGLAYRRATNARVRRTTSRTDLLVYLLLVVLIVLGCWMTFAHNLITSRPTTTATRSRSGGARCSSCSRTSRPSRTRTSSTRCTRSSPGGSGRCSRSAAWSTPGASRCSTSVGRTSSTGAVTRSACDDRRRPTVQLTLATVAFVACFYAWACSGRSARTCRSPSACRTSRPRRSSPSPCCWARSCGSRSAGSPTVAAAGACSPRSWSTRRCR